MSDTICPICGTDSDECRHGVSEPKPATRIADLESTVKAQAATIKDQQNLILDAARRGGELVAERDLAISASHLQTSLCSEVRAKLAAALRALGYWYISPNVADVPDTHDWAPLMRQRDALAAVGAEIQRDRDALRAAVAKLTAEHDAGTAFKKALADTGFPNTERFQFTDTCLEAAVEWAKARCDVDAPPAEPFDHPLAQSYAEATARAIRAETDRDTLRAFCLAVVERGELATNAAQQHGLLDEHFCATPLLTGETEAGK